VQHSLKQPRDGLITKGCK